MFTQFLYRVDNCSSCCHLCKLVKVLALSKRIFHLNDAEMCFFYRWHDLVHTQDLPTTKSLFCTSAHAASEAVLS